MTWGYHLIANLKNCSKQPNIFSGKKYLKQSTKDLDTIVKNIIKNINAKAYGNIVVNHFGDDPKIAGLSMYQLIETSNLSAHFVDKSKDIYFDIFSCQKYDPKLVETILKKEFEPETIDTKFLER